MSHLNELAAHLKQIASRKKSGVNAGEEAGANATLESRATERPVPPVPRIEVSKMEAEAVAAAVEEKLPVVWFKLRELPREEGLPVLVLLSDGAEVLTHVVQTEPGMWWFGGMAGAASIAAWRYPEGGTGRQGKRIQFDREQGYTFGIQKMLEWWVARGGMESHLQALWRVVREMDRQCGLGYVAVHDDCHRHGELVMAARCYLASGCGEAVTVLGPFRMWPEEWGCFHASADPGRDFEKGAALVISEIARRLRLPAAAAEGPGLTPEGTEGTGA